MKKAYQEWKSENGIPTTEQKQVLINDYSETIEVLESVLHMNKTTNYLTETEWESIHGTIKLLTYYVFNLKK